MHLLAAVVTFFTSTTITIPTVSLLTSSTQIATVIPLSTVEYVPTTIVTSYQTTKVISTSINTYIPVTITVSTDVPVPTTTSISGINYNLAGALATLYSIAFLIGGAFAGLSYAANTKTPHVNTVDGYKIASIVVITISFAFTVASVVFQDEAITVKGNIWGNHANVAVDVVTVFGIIGCVGGGKAKYGFKGTKEVIKVWMILGVAGAAAIVGVLSSGGSIYPYSDNPLSGMRYWYFGFICWVVGVYVHSWDQIYLSMSPMVE